jgi:MFS transporter, ACS family, tartrate transporter
VTGIPTTGVFYSLRLLLGACEAGFFPCIIFYLTLWFPAVYRARVISLFMLAIPISSIIGSPISGMLLGLTGWGLEGWQWLFILEALPSVLVGISVLIYLTDFPRQARWLQQDEIVWLENVQATRHFLLFSGPWAMVLLGGHSDRTMERKGHVPMFWPLPASFLTGASAAAGIAAINSPGNLSGFAGPYAMGCLKDLTGNFTAGLLLLAGCALVGAIVVVMLRIDARREQLSGEIAMAH